MTSRDDKNITNNIHSRVCRKQGMLPY